MRGPAARLWAPAMLALLACTGPVSGGGAVPHSAACRTLPPSGQAQTVLSLDVADATSPREPPLLRIDSDGGIAVRRGAGLLRGRIGRDALARLLEDIVAGQDLLAIDGAAIRAALAAAPDPAGGPWAGGVADAPTSFLTLSLPGCRHEVIVHGSAFAAAARPDIAALQRFRLIEERLLGLVTAVQQG